MEVKEGFKQTEVGEIPEDWLLTNISSVYKVIDGDRGANYPSAGELLGNGYCLFLNAGNVTKAGFRFFECQFISEEKDNHLNKGKLKRGDVVLTTRGTVGNFALYSGEVYFAHVRINSGMVILRNQAVEVDNRYMYSLLSSSIIGSQIDRMSFGSAQPQLTVKGIETFTISLPPTKAEQEAIAEALSDADGLIESLEQLIAKKRQIKQGAMQELLTGKRRLPGFNKEWKKQSIGRLFDFSGGVSASRDQLSTDGYCYLHYGDIHASNKMYLDVRAEYSDIPKLDIPLAKASNASLLKDGDIVFVDASEDDEGVSKHIVVINPEGIPFISGLHTIVAKSKTDDFTYEFRRYCFQTFEVKKQFRFYAAGAKVTGVSKGNIKKIKIVFPEHDEQIAIATILSDMDAEITELETKLTKARKVKQGMMQELLTGRIRLV